MSEGNILLLNDSNFTSAINESTLPVLVDFWADWCGPCKMIAPVIEEIASEYEGRVKIAKLNVDENQNTPSDLKVISIPSLIIFKGGKEINRYIGFKTKDELSKILEQHI